MGAVNDHIQSRLDFALASQAGTTPPERFSKLMFEDCGAFINAWCVKIGVGVSIFPGSSIGFKGFSWGFREDQTPEEIVHRGGVLIGDHVDIGPNCNIARATLEGTNTILGDHVKVDSMVHIAHNCVIEPRCVLTASVCIGGSAVIGERSWLGMNCTIMNGVTIGKNNIIGIGAVIRKDTEDNAVMYGQNQFLRYR